MTTEEQVKLIAEELQQAFIIGVAQEAGHFEDATIEEIVAVILGTDLNSVGDILDAYGRD